jgi:hypothetical protein
MWSEKLPPSGTKISLGAKLKLLAPSVSVFPDKSPVIPAEAFANLVSHPGISVRRNVATQGVIVYSPCYDIGIYNYKV